MAHIVSICLLNTLSGEFPVTSLKQSPPLLQLIQLQFISFNQKKVSPYLSTFLANGHR